jgi:hypothetical protein
MEFYVTGEYGKEKKKKKKELLIQCAVFQRGGMMGTKSERAQMKLAEIIF